MMNNLKRLHLAVLVLKISLLLMKNAEVAIELISKVVNYARSVRKFPSFLLEKRQTDFCAQPLLQGPRQ